MPRAPVKYRIEILDPRGDKLPPIKSFESSAEELKDYLIREHRQPKVLAERTASALRRRGMVHIPGVLRAYWKE